MYCSYYDRLLIMGDDMFIIAYEQAVIMHDQRHIHVIMNIIVNPNSRARHSRTGHNIDRGIASRAEHSRAEQSKAGTLCA